ncbi:MAG: hypothetical protein R3B93_08140 [Bacteroidia bacterium]
MWSIPEKTLPIEKRQNNEKTIREFKAWKNENLVNFLITFLHFPDLPAKHAGVGLARKIGMDEAVDRLIRQKIQRENR